MSAPRDGRVPFDPPGCGMGDLPLHDARRCGPGCDLESGGAVMAARCVCICLTCDETDRCCGAPRCIEESGSP